MRHRKKGRKLGRNPSHQRALLRSLATALILTERDPEEFDSSNPTMPKPPAVPGRIVTTLPKAKEVRPLIEKCVTIARRALKAQEEADRLEPDAVRGSNEWQAWRNGPQWQEWNHTVAPVVAARRRCVQLLGNKKAVEILFDEIAPRFEDRPGGYTRILRLAGVRLGDAGQKAILEFVGKNDRERIESEAAPKIDDDVNEETVEEQAIEEQADATDEVTAETEADEQAVDEQEVAEEEQEK